MTHPYDRLFTHNTHLSLGCMGFGGGWDSNPPGDAERDTAQRAIEAALEGGIRVFDHADIYTHGKAEQVFGDWLGRNPNERDRIVLQSKCGIRFADGKLPGRYDFSPDWIRTSVEGSLRRLQTDYLDVLLLHRPDPLCEPQEVAAAFSALQAAGKVRHLGVSNMHIGQMRRLQSALHQPLVCNQLQLSLGHHDWLDEGVEVGTPAGRDVNFAHGTLEYCQAHDVQIQSWGPLDRGRYCGAAGSDQPEAVHATASIVSELSETHGVEREAIVLAWLLRHPGGIQPVIGTTRPERIAACAAATRVALSREDWYRLYVAARGRALP